MNEEKLPIEAELEQTNPDEEIQQPLTDESNSETPVEEQPVDPLSDIIKKQPYHERYYLKYRGGKRTAELDLQGTKEFLQGIGFDGGELLQARKGKDHLEAFQSSEQNKKNQDAYYGKSPLQLQEESDPLQ